MFRAGEVLVCRGALLRAVPRRGRVRGLDARGAALHAHAQRHDRLPEPARRGRVRRRRGCELSLRGQLPQARQPSSGRCSRLLPQLPGTRPPLKYGEARPPSRGVPPTSLLIPQERARRAYLGRVGAVACGRVACGRVCDAWRVCGSAAGSAPRMRASPTAAAAARSWRSDNRRRRRRRRTAASSRARGLISRAARAETPGTSALRFRARAKRGERFCLRLIPSGSRPGTRAKRNKSCWASTSPRHRLVVWLRSVAGIPAERLRAATPGPATLVSSRDRFFYPRKLRPPTRRVPPLPLLPW